MTSIFLGSQAGSDVRNLATKHRTDTEFSKFCEKCDTNKHKPSYVMVTQYFRLLSIYIMAEALKKN